MAFRIEKESLCNRLVVTVSPFIGITAVPTEGEFSPPFAKLKAQIPIGHSIPDFLKGFLMEVTQDMLFLGIIAAGTDRSIPMDDRVVPELFTRILLYPDDV